MAKKRKLDPLASSAAAADVAGDDPPSPASEHDTPLVDAEQNAPVDAVPNPADSNGSADAIPEPAADSQNGPASDSETEAEPDEPESLRDLLDPLTKEQLVELLLDAASRHADVAAKAAEVAGNDPFHRKVFVHGLGWDTTTETLAAAFSPFGEIEECKAVRDKSSGKSKGYGFVLFRHRAGARAALREPQKRIGNRMTACQLASAGPVPPNSSAPVTVAAPAPAAVPPVAEYTQRKIFVSNVGPDIDPQRLLQYFARYGEIEEGPLGLDKQTGKPKGFCLFVYKKVESAQKALEQTHQTFEGHALNVNKAIDGPKGHKVSWAGQQSSGGWGQNVVSHSGGHFAKTGYAMAAAARGAGHLMAPAQPTYGQAVQQPPAPTVGAGGINPALGQALTTLLANPTAALGLSNLLGSLGSAVQAGGQGMQPQMGAHGGYGGQGYAGQGGGYGGPAYSAGRGQGGYGGPPYMGR